MEEVTHYWFHIVTSTEGFIPVLVQLDVVCW
jgi:hypothetical protein